MNKEKIEQEIIALQSQRQEIDDTISRKQVLLSQLTERADRVAEVIELTKQFEMTPEEVFGASIKKTK